MEKTEKDVVIQACYVNGKSCVNGSREDFGTHPITGEKLKCNKWVRLIGDDPQTGADLSGWCCNEFAKTKLAVEQANMVRQNTKSTDKVSNVFFAALPPQAQRRVKQRIRDTDLLFKRQNALPNKHGNSQ